MTTETSTVITAREDIVITDNKTKTMRVKEGPQTVLTTPLIEVIKI